jgi:hypothetical protein
LRIETICWFYATAVQGSGRGFSSCQQIKSNRIDQLGVIACAVLCLIYFSNSAWVRDKSRSNSRMHALIGMCSMIQCIVGASSRKGASIQLTDSGYRGDLKSAGPAPDRLTASIMQALPTGTSDQPTIRIDNWSRFPRGSLLATSSYAGMAFLERAL